MLRILCVLLLTTATAAAQMMTVAEYETLMRERQFANPQDRLDFFGMQMSANRDNSIAGSTRLIERGSADREVLAFAHVWRARQLPESRFDEAVRDYEEALELSSQGKPFILVRLGEAFAKRDWNRAMRHFELAIAHNQKDPYPYFRRGRVHQEAGKLELAIQDFDVVIAIAPRRASAYVYRAQVQHVKGDVERAVQDYLKAFEVADPQFVKNAQWTLKERKFFRDEPNGVNSGAFRDAVMACVRDPTCQSPVSSWSAGTHYDKP